MTDATAQWFLAETTAQRSPWPAIEVLLNAADSTAASLEVINQLRESQQLRDDDVTLAMIEVVLLESTAGQNSESTNTAHGPGGDD